VIAPDFRTIDGIPVFLEVSHARSIVDVDVIVQRGSLLDPKGVEGLTQLTARLMRRGPAGVSAERFDARLDALGATLSAGVGHETMRIQGSVIRRNLAPFLAEVAAILRTPGLRRKDFARLKRTTEAELVQLRDRDGALASRAFRAALFGRHRYGRPTAGTRAGVASITLDAVRAHHARLVRAPHLVLGLAGDVTRDDAQRLVAEAFGDLPGGSTRRPAKREPKMKAGRRIVLVDKPSRTQAQLVIGTLGMVVGAPDHHAMAVANTAFGGTFTSRLMHEVRSERGWSYGAYSRLGSDRQREAWSMWTQPGAEQLVDCLRLQLALYDAWRDRGLTRDEVRRAKRYLVKSFPFDVETACKRLERKLRTAIYDLPDDWYARYPSRIRAVKRADANAAVAARLSGEDLTIGVVATATDALRSALRSIDAVRAIRVVPFDEL